MLTALVRTLILYVLTAVAVRCMGKRQVGELEPSEFVVTLLISDLATLSMQDPESPLAYSVIPIATLVVAQISVSCLSLKFPAFYRLMNGRYSVLIDDGKIRQREMARAQLTIGELMEEIRQNGCMSVDDVKYCVLETGGKISVIPKSGATQPRLPAVLIADGKPIRESLDSEKITDSALREILRKNGVRNVGEVFLLYGSNGSYTCIRKEKKP